MPVPKASLILRALDRDEEAADTYLADLERAVAAVREQGWSEAATEARYA